MLKKLICAFVLTVCLPLITLAQPDVKDVVDEIFTRLKAEKSYKVMTDYIHWETAYQRMSAAERQMMRVNSAKEYREKLEMFLTDPAAAIQAELGRTMQHRKLPPEQQKMMNDMINAQIKEAKRKIDADLEELGQSSYEILESDISASKAKLKVKLNKPSGEDVSDIYFELIDGKWYLPRPSNINDITSKKVSP